MTGKIKNIRQIINYVRTLIFDERVVIKKIIFRIPTTYILSWLMDYEINVI